MAARPDPDLRVGRACSGRLDCCALGRQATDPDHRIAHATAQAHHLLDEVWATKRRFGRPPRRQPAERSGREHSEEFRGNPEHDGDGKGVNYDTEPFGALDAARRAGKVRVYALGPAFGALDVWAGLETGLETVAVIEADVVDDVFANLVKVNDEGTVLRVGRAQPTAHVPFTGQVVDELWATGRLAPETAFHLRAAWVHRDLLLA